jgi:hypothetical protein
VAEIRVLRTAKAALSRTFYLDEVGTPAAGSVVVTVTRLDGTLVHSADAVGPDVNGAYAYLFPGSDALDDLRISWAATVGGDAIVLDQDRIEIVGAFYFGLSEARAIDPAFANTARYPTAQLVEKRIEAESACERITGQAWVPRFCRETLSGPALGPLALSWPYVRAIRSITLNGVPWGIGAVGALEFTDSGLLRANARGWGATAGAGSRNVTVEYEHGHDNPTPDIRRGAKLHFKSLMFETRSPLPDRAERLVTTTAEGTSTVYRAPEPGRTGIPAVDAIYLATPDPRPGFG